MMFKNEFPLTKTSLQIFLNSHSTISLYSLAIACFRSLHSVLTSILDITLHDDLLAPTTF